MLLSITMSLATLYLTTGCSDDTPPFATAIDTGEGNPTDTGGNTTSDTGGNTTTDAGGNTTSDAGGNTTSDAGSLADSGTQNTGYKLSGQLVPSGGFSMSDTYTLSGSLSPGVAPSEQKSNSYHLTMTP